MSALAQALAGAKWRSSGLTDEQAETLGLRALSPSETARLAPNFVATEALYIPYHRSTNGEPSGFFRVRYLGALPGFAGMVEKPQRYAQPPDSLNEVYFPRLHNWNQTVVNPEIPILITEGELKAAAACARGFACLGLGGVDVWRSQRRGIPMLSGLLHIVWRSRPVFIIFDSDAAHNPNVVRAQRQLAEALTNQGARVRIVGLPSGPNGAKIGLDDYLLTHSDTELKTTMDSSPAWDEGNRLWELNEEVLYIRDPGLVIERNTGLRMGVGDFIKHRYATRSYFEQRALANGQTRLVEKPLAPKWIAWPGRAELQAITFAPGKPRITQDCWNLWEGWGVMPQPGDITPWRKLLDHLFKGHELERQWFERWCAYPLQHPGAKLYSAVLLWGRAQGTGKTLLGYTLARIHGKGAIEVRAPDIRGSFNEWAMNKTLILGDEITGSDKRSDADRIKGLITQNEVLVNQKYVPQFRLPDCANYFFTSQHGDAFFLEDHDRRMFVHEILEGPLPDAFYADYDEWYRGSGAAALFAHLLTLPLGDFNPRARAYQTAARADMIVHSRSDLSEWVHQLLHDPASCLTPLGNGSGSCDLFTSRQLLACYQHQTGNRSATANGMGRALRECGIRYVARGQPLQTTMGQVRLYAIKNVDRWLTAPRAHIEEHFNGHFPGMEPRF